MSYPTQASLILEAAKTNAQSLTYGGFRLLTWDSPTIAKNFTEASDVFTCTIPGTYLFELGIAKDQSDTSYRRCYFSIRVNGSNLTRTGSSDTPVSYGVTQFRPAVFTVSLAVGDTVDFCAYPMTEGGTFATLTGSVPYYALRGYHIGGVGSAIAQSDRPTLFAYVTATSITTGANRKIAFDAPTINTANFTEASDVFTCTIPGIYLVYVRVTLDVTNYLRLQIFKNGSVRNSSNYCGRIQSLCGIIDLAVGDTIEVYGFVSGNCNLTATSGSAFQVMGI